MRVDIGLGRLLSTAALASGLYLGDRRRQQPFGHADLPERRSLQLLDQKV
jgi:hypothetical protein